MPLPRSALPAGWTWRPAPRTHIEHFAAHPSSPQKGPQHNITDGASGGRAKRGLFLAPPLH